MHGLSRKAVAFIILLLGFIALLSYQFSKPNLKLPSGPGRVAVVLGHSHGVVLAADGSLWVWGDQESGWPVLGLGKVESQRHLCRLNADKDWVDVAADGSHTLALKADGTIWAWGENHAWQLGDGTRVPRSTPVRAVPGND